MPKKLTKVRALELCRLAWGKAATVEDTRRETAPELRAAASAELKALRAAKPEWPKLTDLVALPDAMTLGEYRQRLREHNARAAAWRARESDALSRAMRYRFKTGTAEGMFYFVKGEGDTLAEALITAGVLQPDGTPYSWAHWHRPSECTCIKHLEDRIVADRVRKVNA